MKFFDYKFIILLALTLIIYFLYREVDSLNARINKLENNIKKEENKQIIQETASLLQPEPPVLLQNTQPSLLVDRPTNNLQTFIPNNLPTIMQKNTSVGLLPTIMSMNSAKNISVDLLPTMGNTLYNIESDSDSESDNEITHTTSQSSKHLAIYSNDNEQSEDTHNSLLESVALTKKQESFDFNYTVNMKDDDESESEEEENIIITESSEHVELKQMVNNIISESSDSQKNIETPIIVPNNKTQDTEIKVEVNISEGTEIKVEENMSEGTEIKEAIVSKVEDNSSSSEINIVVKTSKGEDSKRKYDRMKLQELQSVAKEMEINLVKKIKGNDKMKTKNELIKEILKKNI
jgi:hypothetical protein